MPAWLARGGTVPARLLAGFSRHECRYLMQAAQRHGAQPALQNSPGRVLDAPFRGRPPTGRRRTEQQHRIPTPEGAAGAPEQSGMDVHSPGSCVAAGAACDGECRRGRGGRRTPVQRQALVGDGDAHFAMEQRGACPDPGADGEDLADLSCLVASKSESSNVKRLDHRTIDDTVLVIIYCGCGAGGRCRVDQGRARVVLKLDTCGERRERCSRASFWEER